MSNDDDVPDELLDNLPEGAKLLFAGKNAPECKAKGRPCFHCMTVELVGAFGKEFNVPMGDAAAEILHALATILALIETNSARKGATDMLVKQTPELVETIHAQMQALKSKTAPKH